MRASSNRRTEGDRAGERRANLLCGDGTGGRGRSRAAEEEVVHDIEDVGRMDGAVAVGVARHHAGRAFRRRTAGEEIADEIEDIGWVDDAVAVRIELACDVGEAAGARGGEVVGVDDGDGDRAGSVRRCPYREGGGADADDVRGDRAAEGDDEA